MTKPPPGVDEADEAKRAVAMALRETRKNALAKQMAGARSRLALRHMVSERLSRPLLEQMHSVEFEKNPLAEDEIPEGAIKLGLQMQAMQRDLMAAARAYEIEDETPDSPQEKEAEEVEEEGDDEEAMAEYEARFMSGDSSSASVAPRNASAARSPLSDAASSERDLDVSSSGLDDLVRLKGMVISHDVTGSGLDADEFVAALGQMWRGASPTELTRLFMQIDADSDGRKRSKHAHMHAHTHARGLMNTRAA